jgi:hypothetical protein
VLQSQLPDCDMTDNSTGTVVPAFPPDGTQCLAMPSNLCTLPPSLLSPVLFGVD